MGIYGIDAGGTNLRFAEIDESTGKIIRKLAEVPMEKFLSNQDLTNYLLSLEIPANSRIGMCSAGSIDEENLTVKESPNSPIKYNITFAKDLAEKGHSVSLTNDMKAAVQGVAKFGDGKEHSNILVATYSSGYNCAVARNGSCVTHAEAGHFSYMQSSDIFCGCGGRGHLETYVSGNGAAAMANQYFKTTKKIDHIIMKLSLKDFNRERGTNITIEDLLKDHDKCTLVRENIGAKHVYIAYGLDKDQDPQKSIRHTQVKATAFSFGMMNSAYNPLDIMFIMGSQTNDWDKLFAQSIKIYESTLAQFQLPSLNKPAIAKLDDPDIGLKGAVADYLNKNKQASKT